VWRLLKAFRSARAASLVSKKRGRPSNRRTAAAAPYRDDPLCKVDVTLPGVRGPPGGGAMPVVSMSKKEFDRLEVLLGVQSGRLRVADACDLLSLKWHRCFGCWPV
jgi:hypothetical protein